MRDGHYTIVLHAEKVPIASYLLFTQPGVLDDNIPEERNMGIAAGLAWIRVADGMVVYTDYGSSRGVKDAVNAGYTCRFNHKL